LVTIDVPDHMRVRAERNFAEDGALLQNIPSQIGSSLSRDSGFIRLVVVGILLLQFILLSLSSPVGELFSPKPLFHVDSPLHWYQIKVAEDLFREGRIVGYDPIFHAGYPAGVSYNWSAKVPALLAILLGRWWNEVVVYKLYVFASALIAPACVTLALFLFRLSRTEILIGSLFGLILWWTSIFHWYHTAGMVSFVAGSYVSLPYLAKIFSYLEDGGPTTTLIGLGLFGAGATFWHPLFPVPIVLGMLAYVVTNIAELDRKRLLLTLTIIPTLALLPNLSWLYPTYYYQRVFQAGIEDIAPYGKVVSINNLWRELAGIWRNESHGSHLYLPIALAAIWGWHAQGKFFPRRNARVLVILGIALNLLANLAGGIPALRIIQPNRFAPVGYLFLCLPASLGVSSLRRDLFDLGSRRRWAALAALAVIVVATSYSLLEVRQEISWTHVGHYGAAPPEIREVGDLSKWVVNWLEKETTPDARVLFETSKARFHDGAHMAGYYAYTAQREFIGGPYPFTNFAGFWDGFVFGKPLSQIPQQAFAQYLDTYNIGWMLVHSGESKTYLDQMPGVVPVAAYKGLKAYRCERRSSYFLRGSGRVDEQAINRIVLSDLDGSEIVIKFHYVPGLRSDPPADIVPIKLMDDPNPFIRILNPPKRIRLFMQ
jgi:hypothetical protein